MAEITVFYEGPIVTRSDARRLELSLYFTGNPCIRGHVAQRKTNTKVCLVCYTQRRRTLRQTEKYKSEKRVYERTPERKAAALVYERIRRQRPERKAAERARMRTPEYRAAKRIFQKNRRSRKRAGTGNFTPAQFQRLLQTQKKCHVCGKRFTKANPATLDHVIALADGGLHDASNIALAHLSCNVNKGMKRTHLL